VRAIAGMQNLSGILGRSLGSSGEAAVSGRSAPRQDYGLTLRAPRPRQRSPEELDEAIEVIPMAG
jgi:hypothetical protein